MPVNATRNSKLNVHTYNWVPLMSLNHHLNSELGFRVLARITDLSIKQYNHNHFGLAINKQ